MTQDYPDYEGNKVKLYTVAEWAALEATDKNWFVSDVDIDYGGVIEIDYPVPADKTLYIAQISFSIYATNVADADNASVAIAKIEDFGGAGNLFVIASREGFAYNFIKPLRFIGGSRCFVALVSRCNHNCVMGLSLGGYEI